VQPFRDRPAATLEEHKIELAAELLRSGGRIRIRALGTSMLPTIFPGDVLQIESAPLNELAVGDVVLIKRGNRIIIHRLVSNEGEQWVTRGDAVPQDDPPVVDEEFLGRITQIDRGSRAIEPRKRVQGVLAWVLCRWQICRNLALRAHALRQRSLRQAEKMTFGQERSEAS
jgi:signal peptidase I